MVFFLSKERNSFVLSSVRGRDKNDFILMLLLYPPYTKKKKKIQGKEKSKILLLHRYFTAKILQFRHYCWLHQSEKSKGKKDKKWEL